MKSEENISEDGHSEWVSKMLIKEKLNEWDFEADGCPYCHCKDSTKVYQLDSDGDKYACENCDEIWDRDSDHDRWLKQQALEWDLAGDMIWRGCRDEVISDEVYKSLINFIDSQIGGCMCEIKEYGGKLECEDLERMKDNWYAKQTKIPDDKVGFDSTE